jgi:hypothetical protein
VVRLRRSETDRTPHAVAAQPDEDRAIGAGRVHDGLEVVHEAVVVVGRGIGRTIGSAVPAAVIRDDAIPPAEVGDLRLPLPRVDDRCGRHQDEGRLARAVHVEPEADAIGRDRDVAAIGLDGATGVVVEDASGDIHIGQRGHRKAPVMDRANSANRRLIRTGSRASGL